MLTQQINNKLPPQLLLFLLMNRTWRLGCSTLMDLLDERIRLKRKTVIACVNPHSYYLALKHNSMLQALVSCTVLIPDGIGVGIASLALRIPYGPRVTGPDLHDSILARLSVSHKSIRVFYLGSSQDSLVKLREAILRRYPKIASCGIYSPPYISGVHWNEVASQEMILAVNAFAPDVLFIGATAPKQEIFAYLHAQKLNATIIASIGAVFDFHSGVQRRCPRIVSDWGLQWIYRLLCNPRRMWTRTGTSMPAFIRQLLSLLYSSSSFSRRRWPKTINGL